MQRKTAPALSEPMIAAAAMALDSGALANLPPRQLAVALHFAMRRAIPRQAQDAFEEGKHPRSANGQFGTAGGMTHEEHDAAAEKHEGIAAKFHSTHGHEPSDPHRTSGHVKASHNMMAGSYHRQAARHLRNYDMAAGEAAERAAHHAQKAK